MNHDFNLVVASISTALTVTQVGFQALIVFLGIMASMMLAASSVVNQPLLMEEDWFEVVEYRNEVDDIASPLKAMHELMQQEEADEIPSIWNNYLLPSEELVVVVPMPRAAHEGVPLGMGGKFKVKPQFLLV